MADLKISQLSSATLPLAGTEVLPIVQSSSTKKVTTDDLTVKNVRSNATTGILQIAGPGAGTTRTMTTPNANFTAARTDAAQSFTGDQTLSTGNLVISTANKGVTGAGGVFLQKYDIIASAGTLDLTIDPNAYGFAGILSVSATRYNYNPQSRRTVYAVTAYGTTMTTSSLLSQDGAGGGSAFTISCPSAGVVRVTDTSGSGSQIAVYIVFSGALNFAFS